MDKKDFLDCYDKAIVLLHQECELLKERRIIQEKAVNVCEEICPIRYSVLEGNDALALGYRRVETIVWNKKFSDYIISIISMILFGFLFFIIFFGIEFLTGIFGENLFKGSFLVFLLFVIAGCFIPVSMIRNRRRNKALELYEINQKSHKKIESDIDNTIKKISCVFNNEISPDYCIIGVLDVIKGYFLDGRADTLKEAINMFVEEYGSADRYKDTDETGKDCGIYPVLKELIVTGKLESKLPL